MVSEPETEAVLVPVPDDGLMNLNEFVEKARDAILDMPETYPDCTGNDPDERLSLDSWLEHFGNLIHNS